MNLPEERRNRVWLDLLAIFGAAVLITLPVFLFGVPRGNDLPQHYQFAVTFYENAKEGVFFPSWPAEVNSGFGDVGVRFYPPLSYYVLDFFRTISGNWLYASGVTFCFWFFLGGAGVYLWAREWFSSNASLAAATAYIFFPYHANEIYNAFTYAEFAAAAILPFSFLFVTRVCNRGKLGNCVGLAVSFAFLILTNLPLAVIGSVSLLVYALATIQKARLLETLIRLGGCVAMSLLATSFYWVRIVSELPYLNHESQRFLSQAYDFRNNFLWSFFTSSSEAYSERSLIFVDLMLLVTVAMFVPFAIAKYRSGGARISGVWGLLILGLFFATPLSFPVWSNVDLLQKVQFPWRWMTIISLAASILIASGFDHIKGLFAGRLRPLAIIAFGLLITGLSFTVAQVIRPALYLETADFDSVVNRLSTSQSYDCWWPIWAKKEAFANTEEVSAGGRNIEIERWLATERDIHVSSGAAVKARFATFYYPNWQAEVDHKAMPVSHDDNGAIVIALPAEPSEVKLYFRETGLVGLAGYVSIVCWLLLGLLGVYLAVSRLRNKLI